MYRVLIVDDNPLIRMGLNNMIPWTELNLGLSGSAGDGDSAIAKWQEYNPDIVITDIRMPGKDGLFLMDYIRKRNENVQVIVISAYDEFEYAKEAIRFRSLNYILKPIDKKELISTLKKAILCLNECNHITHVNENNLNVFSLKDSLAIQNPVSDSYEENARFYLIAGKPEELMMNLICILNVCSETDIELLKNNRRKIIEYLKYLVSLAPECGDTVFSFIGKMENQETQGAFQSEEHFQKELYCVFNKLCEQEYIESKNNRGLAFRLKNVIDNNYWMNLILEVLSEQFNYSQVYISKIFKQECGITIGKYITQVRMKHAYEMICHTDLKIIDIAQKAGFSDYIYFAKQFKKYFGQTPGRARRSHDKNIQ